MGIQTTVEITRSEAIARIQQVEYLYKQKNFRRLEGISQEVEYNLLKFVEDSLPYSLKYDLVNFTNTMLEEVMDLPFFRYSLYENYEVVDDE